MRRVSDTEYRLLSQLILFFGEEVPYTGLPTDTLYNKFYQLIDSKEQNVILVLDEIDALIGKIGDGILYNLTRINQELKKSKLTLVGISNNVAFIENLDPRVKSSLSEEEIIFPPYNANELKNILKERVALAFCQEAVSEGVVSKCAALAAQEHGDARKALDLLRVAGETAERRGFATITEEHVDEAESRLDIDKTIEIVKTQPKHSQAVYLAIMKLHKDGHKNIQTGDIFDQYAQICKKNSLKQLTQRRVSDLISELDMFGLVNAKVISKGRYGRTREISINLSKKLMERLEEILCKEFA
jgi:cell division control protein 6